MDPVETPRVSSTTPGGPWPPHSSAHHVALVAYVNEILKTFPTPPKEVTTPGDDIRTSIALLLLSMVVVKSMDAATAAMVVFRNSGAPHYHSMLLFFTNVRLRRRRTADRQQTVR